MIKDVKSYISVVGDRLGKAFSMEAFGTEQELEFWELSAEHVSRREMPAFSDIVQWMDLLYQAPVHFVYKKEGEKLFLHRRHINSDNILNEKSAEKLPHEQTQQEKEYIEDFEYQLQNLEKKMDMDDVFLEHGISTHAIGQCEHIPLFDKKSEFWGVYCVGPYTKSPQQIVPKLSIVGRLLSSWMIGLDQQERNPKEQYKEKIDNILADLGSGKLNAKAIAEVILRYVVNWHKSGAGCVITLDENGHKLLASVEIDESVQKQLNASGDKVLFKLENENVKLTSAGEALIQSMDINPVYFPFLGDHSKGFLMIDRPESETEIASDVISENIGKSLADLYDYQNKNEIFSEKLMDGYYKMLRTIETSRDKTKHHTPRMMAFTMRFGMFFGLEDDEMQILNQTAKLHDIGYVGATSIESGKTIGGEQAHPIIGANLIEHLAVHKDVVEGIKTHHEWVNGEGSPNGLGAEGISWTGKIIGVFEYVVDFIETHEGDDSKSDEEWMKLLTSGLMERADIQYDMIIIPTAIQLLQALGWESCVTLGVD